MDQVCFRLPDGIALPATAPGRPLRLRAAEAEALSEVLQAFACGEESAALAFGQLARHPAGAAARDALAVIDDEGLVENAARRGEELMGALRELQAKHDLIQDVRGKGLIIGLEFGRPAGLKARTNWAMLQKARVGLFAQMVVVALFQRHRILTQVSGDHMEVIKLIPPLMISDTEVKLFTESFAEVMEDASKGSGLMWDFGRTLVKQAIKN